MPSLKNKNLKESYQKLLSDNPEFILSYYSRLSVTEVTDIRKKLREKSDCKFMVIKNNVFRLALKEKKDIIKGANWDNTLAGPIAVVFAKSKLISAAKVLKDYSKENVKMLSGVMESSFYDQDAIYSVADLPSKEELLIRIASSANASVVKMASGMKEVISSLARAIKAVVERSAK